MAYPLLTGTTRTSAGVTNRIAGATITEITATFSWKGLPGPTSWPTYGQGWPHAQT